MWCNVSKHKMTKVQFIVLLLCGISLRCTQSEHRSKRFLLTFPRTSPTRLQIIAGIGIPVDLELESVTIGYVFKCEYFLPENASNYLNYFADPFDLTTRPITGFFVRKKRMLEEPKPTELPPPMSPVAEESVSGYDAEQNQKYEKYKVRPELIESKTDQSEFEDGTDEEGELSDADYWNREDHAAWQRDPLRPKGPQNLATSRWTVYKGLAAMAESKGYSGKACVLRSICESAHASFDYTNGILGELMHIVMTPSTTKDQIGEHGDLEYYTAEAMGKRGEPCDRIFRECKASILDQFTGIYTPMMDIMNRIMS